jgi:hypothetical protein
VKINLYTIVIIAFSCAVNISHADDFYRQIDGIMKPAVNIMQLRQACANGNDSACISVGENPNDPCRPYLSTSAQQYACRVQQCNNGNQLECQKIQAYDQRMRGEAINRENCERNPHSVWNGSFCQNNMR